jgi:hypothetical protein
VPGHAGGENAIQLDGFEPASGGALLTRWLSRLVVRSSCPQYAAAAAIFQVVSQRYLKTSIVLTRLRAMRIRSMPSRAKASE